MEETTRRNKMNIVTLLGRVGKEPDQKYTQSGMAICNLSLATSEKSKGEEKTQWHRLVSFGKTAELIEQYVKKGDQLAIEGKISYGSYDKDGTTVYTTDIIVNRIHFVSSKSNQNQERKQPANQGYGNQQRQEPNDSGAYHPDDLQDSDIPF